MPLIRFDSKRSEGFYLLATSGQITCLPNRVYGATESLLQQLAPLFQEKGIRFHRLSQEEADQLLKPTRNGSGKK